VRAGVKVVAGTDCGVNFNPHHGYVGGLESMGWCGMANDAVLHAATALAADALGLGAVTGRLAPGFDADLIAVGGDPRRDLAALHDLRFVATRGVPFVPDALPSTELTPEERELRRARIAALAGRVSGP
jgi:imidazolonepropionase-like amidohydrolase